MKHIPTFESFLVTINEGIRLDSNEKNIDKMKHIQTFESFLTENLNEGKFQDLQNFLNELVALVQKNKKDFSLENNRGILLDVVGGFGFKQETVVIEWNTLAKELGTPEKFIEEMVLDTFNKYKSVLRKGTTRDGGLFVTYKK